MRHLQTASVPLEQQPLGEGYSGPETAANAELFATGDKTLQIGVWSYAGELISGNSSENHQAWVVLRGEVSVTLNNEVVRAGVGDTIVFEAPYGPKTLVASADFRAIWIAVQAER